MEELTSHDGVWKMDVDAFVPKPEGIIKVKGIEYPIYSFLDVPIADSLRATRLAEELNAPNASYEERLERSIDQIMLLNAPGTPKLTREVFDAIPPREIVRLTVLASSIAQVPLKTAAEMTAPGDPGASPSPSAASVASTAGGSESSSA